MKTNKIIDVQEMLFRQMKRLDDDTKMLGENSRKEIARSTALYNQATGFIKAVNTNLKIMELAKKDQNRIKDITKYLGLEDE